MKTVKEYAESVGKTREAVYKQLKAKKNQERLKGHVWQQSGTTYLDDVAVEMLNESRQMTQVKQDQQLKFENEKMIREIDKLKTELLEVRREMQNRSDQMLALSLDLKEKNLLLEQKKDQADRIQELQKDKSNLQAEVDRLKTENDRLYEQIKTQSNSENRSEIKKGFFARLFGGRS